MTKTKNMRSVGRSPGFSLAALMSVALLSLAPSGSAVAHGGPGHDAEKRCVGSYLVRESTTGIQTLWTFHGDGTLVSASAGEAFFNLSSQHGSWKHSGRGELKAVQLNFDWAADGGLVGIGRVDIELSADDGNCDTVSGSFVGRVFAPEQDPLLVDGVAPLFGDSFTGRRIAAR